jgi:hypothetical protein
MHAIVAVVAAALAAGTPPNPVYRLGWYRGDVARRPRALSVVTSAAGVGSFAHDREQE